VREDLWPPVFSLFSLSLSRELGFGAVWFGPQFSLSLLFLFLSLSRELGFGAV
jgi:hypothetical protein